MMWKGVLLISLAVGVLARFEMVLEERNPIQDMFNLKCSSNHPDAALIEGAVEGYLNCLNDFVNVDVMKKDICEARPNKAVDEVFMKYSAQTPQLKTCIHTLVSILASCLEASDTDTVTSAVSNAGSKFMDFMCYKHDDSIALFIAEKCMECFQEKMNGLVECTLMLNKIETPLTIDEQRATFDELAECMVKVLEECSMPTSAIMVEDTLKFISVNYENLSSTE